MLHSYFLKTDSILLRGGKEKEEEDEKEILVQ